MVFELGLGFLVGSLLLLALVLYVTRIRRPAVPRATVVGGERPLPATEPCDLCEEERVCTEVGDLTVCASCEEELLA